MSIADEVAAMDPAVLNPLLEAAKFGAISACRISGKRQVYGLNRVDDTNAAEPLRAAWCDEVHAGDTNYIDYVAGSVDPSNLPPKRRW